MIVLFYVFLNFLINTDPVKWDVKFNNDNGKETLLIHGIIEKDWYVYGPFINVSGPMPLNIQIEKGANVLGKLEPLNIKSKLDPVWLGEVSYFENSADLILKIKNKKDKVVVVIKGQVCNDKIGTCIPINKIIELKTIKK